MGRQGTMSQSSPRGHCYLTGLGLPFTFGYDSRDRAGMCVGGEQKGFRFSVRSSLIHIMGTGDSCYWDVKPSSSRTRFIESKWTDTCRQCQSHDVVKTSVWIPAVVPHAANPGRTSSSSITTRDEVFVASLSGD